MSQFDEGSVHPTKLEDPWFDLPPAMHDVGLLIPGQFVCFDWDTQHNILPRIEGEVVTPLLRSIRARQKFTCENAGFTTQYDVFPTQIFEAHVQQSAFKHLKLPDRVVSVNRAVMIRDSISILADAKIVAADSDAVATKKRTNSEKEAETSLTLLKNE